MSHHVRRVFSVCHRGRPLPPRKSFRSRRPLRQGTSCSQWWDLASVRSQSTMLSKLALASAVDPGRRCGGQVHPLEFQGKGPFVGLRERLDYGANSEPPSVSSKAPLALPGVGFPRFGAQHARHYRGLSLNTDSTLELCFPPIQRGSACSLGVGLAERIPNKV